MSASFRLAMSLAISGLLFSFSHQVAAGSDLAVSTESVSSEIIKTRAEELVLIQKVSLSAPVEEVWKAYTTEEGWTGWAAPKAEIDLHVGGTIKTAYQGEIGGEHTNTLQIVNYVPNRLLTLRANVSESWPEIMKKDADRLSNVILFEVKGSSETEVQSFGIGYTNAPEYEPLMKFFIPANESLMKNLKAYVELDTRVDWSE